MRVIEKSQPTNELQTCLKRNSDKRIPWDRSAEAEEARKLLRPVLRKDQQGLCVYTERTLGEGAEITIEHWYPRNPKGVQRDPAKAWDFQNLFLVRKHATYGESRKGNDFDKDLLLSPLIAEDCKLLDFRPNGEIKAKAQPERVEYTTELLRLNDPSLVGMRHTLWRELENMQDGLDPEELRDLYIVPNDQGFLERDFPSVVEAFLAT